MKEKKSTPKAFLTDEQVAKELFGRTMKSSIARCICVSCAEKVRRRDLSEEEKKEYLDTGLCPECVRITEEA